MLASGSLGADREIESFRQMLDSLPKICSVDAPVKLQVNQQKPDRHCHAHQSGITKLLGPTAAAKIK